MTNLSIALNSADYRLDQTRARREEARQAKIQTLSRLYKQAKALGLTESAAEIKRRGVALISR